MRQGALETLTAFGLFAAGFFFLFGVMRYSLQPLLYVDGLGHGWGETAYLVSQMAGIHGFAQAAIVASCGWAVGIGVVGSRAGVLPRWLAILTVIPLIRILAVLGPLGLMPGGFWIVYMLSIPGTFLWFALLGLVLLGPARRAQAKPALA